MRKIYSFKEIVLKNVLDKINDIFSLENDELSILIKRNELYVILSDFYDYYQKKDIVYRFIEMMPNHFEDIVIMGLDENVDITFDFVLQKLQLLELVDSALEVAPNDTKKIVKQLYNKFDRGE